MARSRRRPWITSSLAAAVITAAATAVCAAACDTTHDRLERQLAAELLIARSDLVRLDDTSLSAKNREGLEQRIVGALGLLPWLLRQTCEAAAAESLRAWQQRPLYTLGERDALIADLDAAIARHPLDHNAFLTPLPDANSLREARTIHETYCAGCHDDTGDGEPELLLPARDLFAMARRGREDEFLARLINGVKGDASILFENPLTDAQVGALWTIYGKRH